MPPWIHSYALSLFFARISCWLINSSGIFSDSFYGVLFVLQLLKAFAFCHNKELQLVFRTKPHVLFSHFLWKNPSFFLAKWIAHKNFFDASGGLNSCFFIAYRRAKRLVLALQLLVELLVRGLETPTRRKWNVFDNELHSRPVIALQLKQTSFLLICQRPFLKYVCCMYSSKGCVWPLHGILSSIFCTSGLYDSWFH